MSRPGLIQIPLEDARGYAVGEVRITELPGRSGSLVRTEHEDQAGSLREGATYRYELALPPASIRVEPAELFDPDDASRRTGRLAPGGAVGRLMITVVHGEEQLRCGIDVLPVKLKHQTEYRWMLEALSALASEAILQGFAPSSQAFRPTAQVPLDLLYQRFAVIAARVLDDEFRAALAEVTTNPHRAFEELTEARPAGHPQPSSSSVFRALSAPGPRVKVAGLGLAGLSFLPERLPVRRTEDTLDSPPNRFVKYALERWREVALILEDRLGEEAEGREAGPVRRGRNQIQRVLATLDEVLGEPFFRDVGPLTSFPQGDQVLLKREGYRQITETFALVESGLDVAFDVPGDDALAASQRNVATLYEFWCFTVLAEIVGRCCGGSQVRHIFEPTRDGMAVGMRTGKESRLAWDVPWEGRDLEVELFFNRTFSTGAMTRELGSWSRAMRPDCSVHITPRTGLPSQLAPDQLDIWLHFDAKYRVERIRQELEPDLDSVEEETSAADHEAIETVTATKREDLLKMHAYRDAIRRTAGAYVLYPGDEDVQMREYHELLPGLGAFPLRPTGEREVVGAPNLERFIRDVLSHVAEQTSIHERGRFWKTIANRRESELGAPSSAVGFLEQPPADTDVLCGFVRSNAQREWIERTRLYNLRAGSRTGAVGVEGRELNAPIVLLYQRSPDGSQVTGVYRHGRWQSLTAEELSSLGYPEPRGDLYLVTTLEPLTVAPTILALRPSALPGGGVGPFGAPFVCSWRDVVTLAASDPSDS